MSIEIRGLQATELAEHAQLVYESYHEYVASGERTFLVDPQWWLQNARNDPYYAPEQTRAMWLDGRMVSSVTAYTREVYADGRLAKVGCIGSVCTHPEFRRRGLVRQVLAEAVAWMEQSGFNWSFLFGREEVYGGSGWRLVTALELVADLRLRPAAVPPAQVRPVDPEQDLAVLMDIYARFNRTLTGPIVRNEDYWRWRVLPGRFGQTPAYFLAEAEGRPIGYFAGADGHVREIGWVEAPAPLFAAVLSQWPDTAVHFHCFTADMVRYLRQVTDTPTAAAQAEHPGGLSLPQAYKGLWRYIGDGCKCFPEITDTESLRHFLRRHEYNFWPVDGF
ncbi:MAG: GNAT family N-acetyltransferase [Armatimonadetes bacterium]|nr:GNAT family N-acetyltransferase [Armatimonadota bacterium]